MTAPPRVVLDTNIVLSALVFGGASAGAVRHGWREGRYTPLASRDTIGELMRVLAYPRFRLTVPEQEELLADYLPHVQVVPMPDPPPDVPTCRDVFDLPDLTAAYTMEQALSEAREIGYTGVERGRRMPADTEGLRSYLSANGLFLCGGWCSGNLLVNDVKTEIEAVRALGEPLLSLPYETPATPAA